MKRFSEIVDEAFKNKKEKKIELEAKVELPIFFTQEDKRVRWEDLVKYFKGKARELGLAITERKYDVFLYEDGLRVTIEGEKETVERKKKLADYYDDEMYTYYTVSTEEPAKKPTISSSDVRKIKRISLQEEYEPRVRFDFSFVELKMNLSYEIEIEYIGEWHSGALRNLSEQVQFVYHRVMGTEKYYTNSQRNVIIAQIDKMLPNFASVKANVAGISLFGPKPIDMKHENLSSRTYFNKDVYVTHKVDGKKSMLLILKNNVYFIDGQIINWISSEQTGERIIFLDGEIYNKSGIWQYYPFDLYYTDTGLKYNSTYKDKLKFIASIDGHDIAGYKIVAKGAHLIRDNFYKVMKAMFAEQQSLPYKQDGFIFTPNHTEFQTITRKFTNESLKWKESTNMTIDFQFEAEKNVFFLNIMNGRNLERFRPEGKDIYISKQDAEDYSDGDIVECRFHKFRKRFIPVRLRDDKATPNPLRQATTIWKLIFKPITKEMLLGNDIDAMKNYHRENKKELIKEAVALVPLHDEIYKNPHTRNSINQKIPFLKTIDEKRQSEIYTYFPTSYTGERRNNLLLSLEFIYSVDKGPGVIFCLIGFDSFLKDPEFPELDLLPKADGSPINWKIIKKNQDFPSQNTYKYIISFPRTRDETNLQYYGLNNGKVKGYLIKMGLSTMKKKYFIHYDYDSIFYPVCFGDDLYITKSDNSEIETRLYETDKYQKILNYFNKNIRRAKYEEISDPYFDNCYACKREMNIYKMMERKKIEIPGLEIVEEKLHAKIDKYLGQTINQNLVSINNSVIDVGIGRADRWIESGLKVLGLEPNYKNFKDLLTRGRMKKKNPNLFPINIGINTETDIDEVARALKTKVGLITTFDSLTFFYESEDKINTLINFIDRNLSEDGIVACIALDGSKLLNLYNESKEKITKFYIKKISDRKINISLGKESIVQDQTEYLISFNDFVMRMEKIGCRIIKDYYLDQEKLMTFDEFLYSSSTRCMIFQRQKLEFPF